MDLRSERGVCADQRPLLDLSMTNQKQGEPGAGLAEALAYVARWSGKRVVIKFGGRAMTPEGAGTLIEDHRTPPR